MSVWTNSRFSDHRSLFPSSISHCFSIAFCIRHSFCHNRVTPPAPTHTTGCQEERWVIEKWKRNVSNIGTRWLLFSSNRILISCPESCLPVEIATTVILAGVCECLCGGWGWEILGRTRKKSYESLAIPCLWIYLLVTVVGRGENLWTSVVLVAVMGSVQGCWASMSRWIRLLLWWE